MDVKRMKSVTLDRKLSSTARIPQRSTVVESPAGRMADANGQIVSARNSQIPSAADTDVQLQVNGDEPSQSSSVDVLRPPFARNNTSVMIVNEQNDIDEPNDLLSATRIQPEDDAITLGDIPMLADQSRRDDGRPLLSGLNQLQSLIIRHFALLVLLRTGIGHLIELDDVLELLDVRKSQWWNKIFKGNAKKDQKKKGWSSRASLTLTDVQAFSAYPSKFSWRRQVQTPTSAPRMPSFAYQRSSKISSRPCVNRTWQLRVSSERMGTSVVCNSCRRHLIRIRPTSCYQRRIQCSWLLC